MIFKIEDKHYKYQGNNICSIFGTLKVYDSDQTTVLDSVILSANFDISNTETLLVDINNQLGAQVTEYMNKLLYVETLRTQLFPESTCFNDVLDTIFNTIESSIN
jgi:hypothetical protein